MQHCFFWLWLIVASGSNSRKAAIRSAKLVVEGRATSTVVSGPIVEYWAYHRFPYRVKSTQCGQLIGSESLAVAIRLTNYYAEYYSRWTQVLTQY